jgi:hypothetical protein
VSGKAARTRREARRRERQRQRKAARLQYAAALPGPLELPPDGRALCPHYQPGAVGDDWTTLPAASGAGYDVAVCPGCMRFLFGPGLAALLRGMCRGAA